MGVENEGAKVEEVRHEAVAEKEEVRKEVDWPSLKLILRWPSLKLSLRRSRLVMKLWLSVHFSYFLLPTGRSRRRASILAEQRIAAIYKKEEEDDEDDEDED